MHVNAPNGHAYETYAPPKWFYNFVRMPAIRSKRISAKPYTSGATSLLLAYYKPFVVQVQSLCSVDASGLVLMLELNMSTRL